MSFPLIGREPDIAAVGDLLARARLVTVTGPAGVGKTALARTLAPDVFVDLVPARDAADVAHAAKAGFGPGPTVGDALAARGPVTVVLDNAEQVVDDLVAVLDTWLAVAPEARFLVTSRVVLGHRDEHVHALASLEEQDAVALLAARARQHTGRDVVSADKAAASRLVTVLAGNPLAIELAAWRTRVIGLGEIADRLGADPGVLATGRRDVPVRHRSLRAALAWSWDLLSAEERRVLARASAFRGGFTLEAAEAVIGGDLLDALAALVDQSLVVGVPRAERPTRYVLPVPVRAFARERLAASGQQGETFDRHAAFFLGPGAEDRLVADDADRDNLRATFDRAVCEPYDGDRAVRALELLAGIEAVLGTYRELLPCFDRVLRDGVGPREAAVAAYRGAFLVYAAQVDAGMAALAEALGVAVAAGDATTEAYIQMNRSWFERYRLDPAAAVGAGEGAIAAARRAGVRKDLCSALVVAASAYEAAGDIEGAMAAWREALALSPPDRPRSRGLVLASRPLAGLVPEGVGPLLAEVEHALQALPVGMFAARSRARLLRRRGLLHHLAGRLDEAAADYETSLAWYRDQAGLPVAAQVMARLAHVRDRQGDAAAADALIAEAEAQAGRGIAPGHPLLVEAWKTLIDLERDRSVLQRGEAWVARWKRAPLPGLWLADRLLRQSIAEHRRGLVVDGEGFRLPGVSADLTHRPTLRRVLDALARQRLERPGAPLDTDAVFERGWPGEDIGVEAARNRVRVAVATLRRLGLGDVLQTVQGGYRLDPDIPFNGI